MAKCRFGRGGGVWRWPSRTLPEIAVGLDYIQKIFVADDVTMGNQLVEAP